MGNLLAGRKSAKKEVKGPIRVKVGSVSLPIYRCPTGKYDAWELRYSLGGEQIRRKFADLKKAKREAEQIATRLSNGEADRLRLTNGDASELFRARGILSKTEANCVQSAQFYASIHEALPGVSADDLIALYRRFNTAHSSKTVPEVVEEMVLRKRSEKLSKPHLADLAVRLGAFARAFPVPIADLDGPSLDLWLTGLHRSPRSHLNYLRAVRSLCRFARMRGYLPRDWDELGLLKPPAAYQKAVDIFTPNELRKLLECAASTHKTALVPLALGAFAGVRSAEILRMDWADIGPENVLVSAQKIRSKGRRFVPTSPALASWVEPVRKIGRISKVIAKSMNHTFSRVARDSGVPWRRNALRHSYISYRLAAVENVATVAMECGTSATMIYAHYRDLVTRAQADEWFAIVPNTSQKFIAPNSKTTQVTTEQ